ncbi:hypothetical protein [Streptomyces sp. NPDC002133]|uniref:hypothetical protein n=1 Tax=Streptomyces sp. NPDC002133 TaxID=3154409 RepID=UPI003334184B
MFHPPAPEPLPGPQRARAHTPVPEHTADGTGQHGRLAPAEAAVVIALVGAVTVLAVAQRPLPAVLVALCAAAGALLIRLPAACLLGRCTGGQG